MTADDIRKLNEECQNKALGTGSASAHEAAMNSVALSLLAEIAAQLAEANEHLKKIANPPIVTYSIQNTLPEALNFSGFAPKEGK